jgi:hypothetical protein
MDSVYLAIGLLTILVPIAIGAYWYDNQEKRK